MGTRETTLLREFVKELSFLSFNATDLEAR
jgi:hypothetical protein